MKAFKGIALVCALAACQAKGGDRSVDLNGDGIIDPTEASVRAPDVINQEAPSSPVGTISGVLKDAYTGAAIANAKVRIRSNRVQKATRQDGEDAATVETTSFADGSFLLGNAPGGTLYVMIEADNYTAAEVPVTVQLPDIGGPTNNFVTNTGPVFLVSIGEGEIKVPFNDPDGEPLPDGTQVTGQFTNSFQQVNPNDAFSGLRSAGVSTQVVEVKGGFATFTSLPDYLKCQGLFGEGAAPADAPTLIAIAACSADVNGDGVPDLIVAPQAYKRADLCAASNGILVGPSVTAIFPEADAFELVSSNVARDTNAPPLATTAPLSFTFNRPANVAASSVFVINDFLHDTTPDSNPVTPGAFRYDNSALSYPSEPQLVDPVNLSSGPGRAGLSLRTDGTKRNVYVDPPAGGWKAGARYIVRAVFTPDVAAATTTGAQNLIVVDGSITILPSGPLSVQRVTILRAAADDAGAYTYVAAHLSAVISGKGTNRIIFACSTSALDGEADPYTAADAVTGRRTLRPGRCPTSPITTDDVASLVQVRLRTQTNGEFGVQNTMGDVVDIPLNLFTGYAPVLDSLTIRLLPNPIVDGRIDVTGVADADAYGLNLYANQAPVDSTPVEFTVDANTAQRGGSVPAVAATNFCLSNDGLACP